MYTITDGANLSSLEQAKVNYVDFETAVTRFFKDYLRESAFLRRHPSFFLQYRLMRPFFRKLFPFMYLRKGSTVVQVGCAEWMLDFGVSMPLIMSAVVGPRGRVVVVEPDQKNVDSLTAYISHHGIRNITIVKKAAWKEKCVRDFTFYEDNTGSNIVSETEEAAPWKHMEMYQNRPKRTEKIQMDTIDNICAELGVTPAFVDLTINGAEFEVIQGMPRTLQSGATIAWLFGDRWWWREAFDFMKERGFDITVAASAYSHRVRSKDGRPQVNSHREFAAFQDVMYAVAVPKNAHMKGDRGIPVTLNKHKDFSFSFKPLRPEE